MSAPKKVKHPPIVSSAPLPPLTYLGANPDKQAAETLPVTPGPPSSPPEANLLGFMRADFAKHVMAALAVATHEACSSSTCKLSGHNAQEAARIAVEWADALVFALDKATHLPS